MCRSKVPSLQSVQHRTKLDQFWIECGVVMTQVWSDVMMSGKVSMSQELSRMVSVEVQGGLQETLFPNFCSELKVLISFNELDTNASQAALLLLYIYQYTIVTKLPSGWQ